MPILTINDPHAPADLHHSLTQLEAGSVLLFPSSPINLAPADLAFLLGLQQTDSSLHKNIAYKPATSKRPDSLSGLDEKTADPASLARMLGIMRTYSSSVDAFLQNFLAPYHRHWRLEYASFRPQEEQNRNLPTRKRNDLLHTDAFPTRPTYGARILRFFNNIHPTRTRDWLLGQPFASLAPAHVPARIAPRLDSAPLRSLKAAARATGLASLAPALKRTPYDDFMNRFHNYLKENEAFQANTPRTPYAFPPGSSWMVYTDTIPHAVLSGQYALEQTILVDPSALLAPSQAPLAVLEALSGKHLL